MAPPSLGEKTRRLSSHSDALPVSSYGVHASGSQIPWEQSKSGSSSSTSRASCSSSFWEPCLGKQVRHTVLRRLQPDLLGIPLQQLGRLAAGTHPPSSTAQVLEGPAASRRAPELPPLWRGTPPPAETGAPGRRHSLLDIAQISLRRIAPVVQQDLVKAQLGQLHHQSDQIVLDRLTGWAAPPQLLRIGPPVAAVGPDGICLILGQGVVPEAGQAGHRVQFPAVEGLELAVDVRLSGVDPAEAAMASWETKPSWPRSVFMSSRTLLAPAWAASASAEPSSTAERGTVTAARRGSPSSGVSSGWEAAGLYRHPEVLRLLGRSLL